MSLSRYRAWEDNTKSMRDVLLIDWLNGMVDLSGGIIERDFKEVHLMQSTGLLNCETEDGKNVEGWEGDIADVGWSEQTGDFNSHRIILKSPFDYSTDEARWLIHAEYIIIRGNIYENPELLEARK
ncbi:YopX family protein [Enterococcus avium]|uniref:YopX family protein n=1 Tax=Enterococcus avium TaxID=33945 RepID=A0AAW8RVU6_ENTAV|nr:YopX family protein [Enterococcus avium]MDT2403621.1 YopX family protein [Enterococcus avium]